MQINTTVEHNSNELLEAIFILDKTLLWCENPFGTKEGGKIL